MYSESSAWSSILKLSLKKLMQEPASKIEPSRAYLTSPFMDQAIVDTSPFCDLMSWSPVFMSMKAPVPKVDFAIPFSKEAVPKSDDCWSPIAAAIGISQPKYFDLLLP